MAYHYRVATLYQERIARGTPARWLLLTHGIYGAGSNWRGIARKLVERRPDWGVVLVDLRQALGRPDLRQSLQVARRMHEVGEAEIAGRGVAPPQIGEDSGLQRFFDHPDAIGPFGMPRWRDVTLEIALRDEKGRHRPLVFRRVD